jgi:uncharacterized membrane protein
VIRADVVVAIALMATASYACRAGGSLLMRFVTPTRRTEAWLRAIPVALVGAILGPVAANGGPAEWAALAAAIVVMRAAGNEFVSAFAAIAVVAGWRALAA